MNEYGGPPAFFLIRSHQFFFHNVEVDYIELLSKWVIFWHNLLFDDFLHLKGTETVAELEVEVCKLLEVGTLENMVCPWHGWRTSVCDTFLKE